LAKYFLDARRVDFTHHIREFKNNHDIFIVFAFYYVVGKPTLRVILNSIIFAIITQQNFTEK